MTTRRDADDTAHGYHSTRAHADPPDTFLPAKYPSTASSASQQSKPIRRGIAASTQDQCVWTAQLIARRFEDAVDTARRLPKVAITGYFNSWPEIVRRSWEVDSHDHKPYPTYPPTGREMDRMMETMRWIQLLDDEEDRHLIWDHAKGRSRNEIARRRGISRTTAWRRWQAALMRIVDALNHGHHDVA